MQAPIIRNNIHYGRSSCPSALPRIRRPHTITSDEPTASSPFFPSGAPIRTNFRYGDALKKAVEVDEALGAFDEGLIGIPEGARLNDDGRWSPTTLSPLSTPPSSPPASPRFVPVPLEDLPALIEKLGLSGERSAPLSNTTTPSGGTGPATSVDGRRTRPPSPERSSPRPKSSNKRGKRAKVSAAQVEKGKERAKKRKREGNDDGDEERFRRHTAAFVHRHAKPAILPDDVPINFDAALYGITNGAYTGRRVDGLRRQPWTLEQLRARHFNKFDWDGRQVYAPIQSIK